MKFFILIALCVGAHYSCGLDLEGQEVERPVTVIILVPVRKALCAANDKGKTMDTISGNFS
ncbi:hypothetical protein WN943_009223 [Citrus x changshan-huyou]